MDKWVEQHYVLKNYGHSNSNLDGSNFINHSLMKDNIVLTRKQAALFMNESDKEEEGEEKVKIRNIEKIISAILIIILILISIIYFSEVQGLLLVHMGILFQITLIQIQIRMNLREIQMTKIMGKNQKKIRIKTLIKKINLLLL